MDLDGNISLYIPSKNAEGRDLVTVKRDRVLKEVEIDFADAFGGFTMYEAIGGGQSGRKLMLEPITVVKAFYECSNEEALKRVTEPAQMVKKSYIKRQ